MNVINGLISKITDNAVPIELVQTTSIVTPLILIVLVSSLSYYLIASLLALSPPTSGLGLVLLGRVHMAKSNWNAHIIRSLLETGFWIGVIGFAYFGGQQDIGGSLSLDRLFTALLWGTFSAVSVVLLGDRMENYLSKFKRVRVKVEARGDSERHLRKSSLDSTDDTMKRNNAYASIGVFSLLYLFFFIGYHTLFAIFLLPLTLHNKGYGYMPYFFVLSINLATLAGVTFTATATILVRISPTEKVGRLLMSRVSSARANWKYHTKRSAFELGTWLFVVFGSFYVQYFGWEDLMMYLGVEQFCSGSADAKGEVQSELLRAIWAILSSLQLGTIVGGVLVLSNYCIHCDDVINRSTSKPKPVPKVSVPSSTKSPCPVRAKARQEGLVLYDGKWYSVGKFVSHHPGGAEVLEQYLGTDISFVFRVMHRDPNKIMKYRKPLRDATSEELKALRERRSEICRDMMNDFQTKTKETPSNGLLHGVHLDKFDLESFEKDATALWDQFVEKGYFKPSRAWIIRNTIVLFALLGSSIICMKVLPSSYFVVSGILLGLFWHQSGYLMHDSEHHNVAGNEMINDILGWMYGTVCLGVNGAWWREEHREHHAFLNTYDSKGFKDPQMREDIWIQNKKLIPFFGDEPIHFLTNFQHILFLPVIFLAGRFGIVIDSTLTERKFRPWTKLGNICHILLHYAVLSQSPRPIRVYIIASLWQAILSLQLLGNHYVKPWNYITDATESNFFLWQVLSTQDFSCPNWARWFYGGLNFHYSHHLFPTLSREYFHLTTPAIRALCEKYGLPFQEIAFIDCVNGMVSNFDDVRRELREHGRGSISMLYM